VRRPACEWWAPEAVRGRTAAWIAEAAGGRLVSGDPDSAAPGGAVVDSRLLERGDLFVGLPGTRVDGGTLAGQALRDGAWGVIVAPEHAAGLPSDAVVITARDPVRALHLVARAWGRKLSAQVVAITGSTGKTTTKDALAALLRPHLRTHATRRGFNTSLGVSAAVLGAPADVEALVIEIGINGPGQIVNRAEVIRPTVGVITRIDPDHLVGLGTIQGVARAKAEVIRVLSPGCRCVVPAGEPLLEPHLRDDLDTITVGPGGDVRLLSFEAGRAQIELRGRRLELELPYSEPYNLENTLMAVAAAHALGVEPAGRVDVRLSPKRGQVVALPSGAEVVVDCAKTSPRSLEAALDQFVIAPAKRRIAVLGFLRNLGERSPRYHRAAGAQARRVGIDEMVTVGREARMFLAGFDGPSHSVETPEEARTVIDRIAGAGDQVLLKGPLPL
jgi:UDP-N-acetylmuramoyl-tripeptide--D-alanyl-D-alanine ligase